MRALLLCVLCLIAVLHKTTAFHPILYSPTASPVMGAKTRVSLGMDTVRLQMLSPATHRSALQPNDGRQNCCGAIALSRDSRLYNTASSSVPQKVDAAERVPFPVMVLKFLRSNWLVLGEVLAIYLAKRNPSFGATGGPLRPELFISQLGVMFIFFVNGIQLNLSAGGSPSEIALSTKTNLLIQLYNFGLIPIMFKLLAPYYPDPAFRYGVRHCSANLLLSILVINESCS